MANYPNTYPFVLLVGRTADGENVPVQVTADGAIVTFPDGSMLPTADPHVAGQLWNNAGTVKVSAG